MLFVQLSLNTDKVVTGQSVNDKQTAAFQRRPAAWKDKHQTFRPHTTFFLHLKLDLFLSHPLLAFYSSFSTSHFPFFPLFAHVSVSVNLRSPLWEWAFLLNVFLSDRGVMEDVCLTTVSTEGPWESEPDCVFSVSVYVSGHYDQGWAVSQGICSQLSVDQSVCLQTACVHMWVGGEFLGVLVVQQGSQGKLRGCSW